MLDISRLESFFKSSAPDLRLIYLPEVSSTNTYAWNYYSRGKHTPALIITDNQVAGRGRGSNSWISKPFQSLTFSLLIAPEVKAGRAGLLPIATGLAVAEALDKFDVATRLKWPNDIILNGKKTGGILCESRISSDSVSAVVIGIGININEEPSEFHADLHQIATSLKSEYDSIFDRENILKEIYSRLITGLGDIREGRFQSLVEKWNRRALFIGKTVTMQAAEGTIEGIFKGITDRGEAVLDIKGKNKLVNSGIISDLRMK